MDVFQYFVIARNDKAKDEKEAIVANGFLLASDGEDAKMQATVEHADAIKAAAEKGKVDIIVACFRKKC